MAWETIIGLEVHVQLATRSKMFCACPNVFGAPPNTLTCPVCLGLPGVLPVLNKQAVSFAAKTARALNAQVHPSSLFARKNYFYPDLPKGYQISQYERPLATAGKLRIEVSGGAKTIGITRLHLEEDAGKLVHEAEFTRSGASYVDLNRAGVPLMEIVSEPEISTPEEAMAYLRALRELVRYLKVSDGNMEEGSLRCDANVSVRPEGSQTLGTKAELKNMNSIRFVGKALAYEVERQVRVLESGGKIAQETLLWSEKLEKTLPMRSKEEAHDYRYFPEPDILPITIEGEWIEALPELPWDKRARFKQAYALTDEEAAILTEHPALAEFYEALVDAFPNPKTASNWILVELLKSFRPKMNRLDFSPAVSPKRVARVLSMVEGGVINQNTAKDLLARLLEEDFDPEAFVAQQGLGQISDEKALLAWIEELFERHPSQVKEYLDGKEKVFGFFVGQLMKMSQGKANPRLLNTLLKQGFDARKGAS